MDDVAGIISQAPPAASGTATVAPGANCSAEKEAAASAAAAGL